MANRGMRGSGIAGQEELSYCVVPGRIDRGLILLCDHAGNAMPPGYGTLGLPPEQLKRHIAYDIGAAAVTRALAAALQVPAVLTRYSRLLIDPNRGRDDPTLIMRLSDGAVVPGNRKLDAVEREERLRLYYEPYHRAVDEVIDSFLEAGVAPVLLSIHSFTESWKLLPRPWHVGVLFGDDARLARPLLDAFYAEGDLIVGENEPYAGQLEGDCLWQHGAQRGIASAIVEIRQDLIRDAAGQEAWSERMRRIAEKALQDTGIVGLAATGSGEWGVGSGGAAVGRQRPTPQSRPPHSPLQDLAKKALQDTGIVGLAATGSGEWGVGSGGAAVGRQRPTPQSRPPHSPLQDLARHKDGDEPMTKLDKDLTTELEAAAFRRLVEHFRNRTDVQNIDLMNLAGFCRNCLSNWYQEAAAERGVTLTKDAAREIVYGMPYKEWQAKHQKEASAEAAAAFEKSKH
jgi:predicted N-formylglutamate amidohydrolase